MNDQYTEKVSIATNFLEYAEKYEFALFPMVASTKRPACPWRKESSRDPGQWRAWLDQGLMLGISACASGIVLVDVDVKTDPDPAVAYRYFVEWCNSLGFDPPRPYCQTRSGGWHFAFRCPTGFDPDAHRGLISIKASHFRALAPGEKDCEVISIRNRGYCVAPGSVFQGGEYRFYSDAPPAPHAWPAAFDDLLRLPVVEVDTASGKAGESDRADVAKLVAELDSYGEFDTEPEWFASLGAVKLALGDTEAGREVARQMTHPDATEEAMMDRWNRLAASDPGGPQVRRIATFIHRYREITGRHFPVRKSTQVMFAGVAQQIGSPPLAPELPPCPVPLPARAVMPRGSSLIGPRGEVLPIDSDDSLALDFTDQHVTELRHCEEWGRWLRWDGARWRQDKTSSAYNLVRQHLRRIGGGMHLQDARKILSAKTVAAVERMAKTDPRIATAADIWDADPWLLNTPGGVVDLRTCVIREAQPGDHMTKQTAVTPGGDCPVWKAFLHRSLNGDAELIAFVQRLLGYSLTGDTREQALFFLYGQGGNGKGVLLNTVASILADYAKTAPMATFTDSANASDRHPTDLAGLRGARFVMASETERGRKWAEAKIKSLTGGDPIAARFMGRDFFEYVPQFKLVIAGNHKPRLGTVDEAIRRRMNMVPFTVQIPEQERDKALPDKLRAEWGGILEWMIQGCLAWQQTGLQPPAAVRAATEEYLNSQDALAMWLDERCELSPNGWCGRSALFASWSAWAINAREPIGNAGEFYQALVNKGFPEHKRDGTRGFRGIVLRQFAMPPVPLRQGT